jgi:hypothetical protein
MAGVVLAGAAALGPKGRSPGAAGGLIAAWVSGAVVVAVAQLATRSFAAASPSYNSWMLPVFALLLGSGLASRSRQGRWVAAAGVALLVASYADGDTQLAAHGGLFAHTAFPSVKSAVDRLGPGRVAVVHEADGQDAWHMYYPVHYQYRGGVPQYAFAGVGRGGILVSDFLGRREPFDPVGLPGDYLVVVHSASRTASELTGGTGRGPRPVGDGPGARALKADGRWTLVSESTTPAFVAADVAVFRRAGSGLPRAARP